MSGQGHTVECRKRLEDAMTTDASTATRVKATRVERIIKDLDDSGAPNPSSSSGSGQHKRVRFSDREHLDSKPEGDTETQTGGQEASVARKRLAETDVVRLAAGAEETAEADSDKRIALKRKAEGDASDSEMEDSVMKFIHLWHKEDDPDGEIDLLILQQRDRYVASMHETAGDKPVCEEPKTLFPSDECGWDYIDDTSGKLLNNTLVEKAGAEEMSVIRELGVWEVADRPRDVVFGTRWVDINKEDENKPFYRSRLVVQDYKRQADWSFFTATPPLEALRSLLICATIEERSNDVGQPVAWTEPVVF